MVVVVVVVMVVVVVVVVTVVAVVVCLRYSTAGQFICFSHYVYLVWNRFCSSLSAKLGEEID